MGLNAHVGGEFTLALRIAVIADRAEIVLAVVARALGGGVARFGDGAGIKLSSAMGRSDIGADDALEMDLHCPFAQALGEAGGGLDDQAFMHVADAVAVEDRGAKTFGD